MLEWCSSFREQGSANKSPKLMRNFFWIWYKCLQDGVKLRLHDASANKIKEIEGAGETEKRGKTAARRQERREKRLQNSHRDL